MTNITQPMLETIEKELQQQVARLSQPRTKQFHEMLTYHMGWTGEGAGPLATGKRIQFLPLLIKKKEKKRKQQVFGYTQNQQRQQLN
jgi:hypothetical protein